MNSDRNTLITLLLTIKPSENIYASVKRLLKIIEGEPKLDCLLFREKPLPAGRMADIYQMRLQHLQRKGKECGGFVEAISALRGCATPVRMITCETRSFVIICFADNALQRLVGCIYFERTK